MRSKILSNMKKEVGVTSLHETHLTENEHAKLKRNVYNLQKCSASYKSGNRRGVALLSSGKISFKKYLRWGIKMEVYLSYGEK